MGPPALRRMPTALRLAAIQWGVVFLSAVLVLGTINRAAERLLEREARALVATELRGFADIHALGGTGALRASIDRRLRERQSDAHVYLLLGSDGSVLAGNLARWPEGLETVAIPIAREATIPVLRTDLAAEATVQALAVRLSDDARLLIGRDAAIEARTREELGGALILGIGAATLVAGALGWLLSRLLLSRMMGMRATAQAIMDGDLSRRVAVDQGGDEFDLLAETLNRMLGRLEAQLTALRFASTGIAHDLRAPLTRLRLHLETLDTLETLETGAGERAIAPALDEVARIERILSALLAIARARSGAGRAQMAEIDLAEIAADVTDLYEPMAADRDVVLTLDAPRATPAKGHADLLFVAISNLVENAVQAVGPGGRVAVTTSADAAGASVAVIDNGPGLPPAVRAALASEDNEDGKAGVDPGRQGLGLPLVTAIAAMHDGRLSFLDRHPGLEARLSITL